MIQALRIFWESFFSDERPAPSAERSADPQPQRIAQANDDEPPPSSAPLSGLTAMPIVRTLQAEVRSRAKMLSMPELCDVLRFVDATLAARESAPSPLVMVQILDTLDRVYARSATRDGMVIPLLRAELAEVPRAAFDRALLAIEARGPHRAARGQSAVGVHRAARGHRRSRSRALVFRQAKGLAVSTFVLPTPERRQALAAALWRTAAWIARAYPCGQARRLYLPYLRRVQVLRAPGEFDFDAYDAVTGRRGSFFGDWQAHEAQALRLYRQSPPAAGLGGACSLSACSRGRLRATKGG
jgi:hypothetical protein